MDIDKLPLSIKKFVMNKPYKIDSVGESGSYKNDKMKK